MTITRHMVVTIEYTLKNDDGELIDSSVGGDPLTYLHGARNIIAGLEQALEGKRTGDVVNVRIEPEHGYGEFKPELIQTVPLEMFGGQEVNVDAQFHAEDPQGNPIVVTVVEVTDDEVTVNGNHPLAGVHLNFDVKVLDTRQATQEELDHGHAHGAGGHHH